MDKFYSYTDFLKVVGQCTEETQHEQLLNEIYLDLFLNRLQRLHRIEKLLSFIDHTLDEHNESDFYLYTDELLALQQQ